MNFSLMQKITLNIVQNRRVLVLLAHSIYNLLIMLAVFHLGFTKGNGATYHLGAPYHARRAPI